MGTAIKHPLPDRVKPSFLILTSGHSSIRVPGCQKLQMMVLTRSDTGYFIALPIWQQWASKG